MEHLVSFDAPSGIGIGCDERDGDLDHRPEGLWIHGGLLCISPLGVLEHLIMEPAAA